MHVHISASAPDKEGRSLSNWLHHHANVLIDTLQAAADSDIDSLPSAWPGCQIGQQTAAAGSTFSNVRRART